MTPALPRKTPPFAAVTVAALCLYLCLFLCACAAQRPGPVPKIIPKTPAEVTADIVHAHDHRCTKLGRMLPYLLRERHLAYAADAISNDDRVHMWFINFRSGEWVQIIVDNDTLQACIENDGAFWHNAYDK